jgi:hypothetical protein
MRSPPPTCSASTSTPEAGWSQSDPAVLAAAASNVLHAVNTTAVGLGLDTATTTNRSRRRHQLAGGQLDRNLTDPSTRTLASQTTGRPPPGDQIGDQDIAGSAGTGETRRD